ncbi:NAD(+) diphosphatase [Geopsychrobacter electrodiphilus]|uniref:NAD(+) diphosphatase n=1 Tax=Geopsychrobacter electrodiphilus TaxID=225196 RepID=UPI00037B07F7|nr:NAD(+) diphosphatase [Geopsychrobacter electrodiphilus]
MSYSLPKSYSSCELLPFNRSALEDEFKLAPPAADPGGPGFWLLLQGTRLVMPESTPPTLLHGPLPSELANPLQATYIGLWQGQPCRALSVSRDQEITPRLQAVNILAPEPGLPLSLLSLAGLGNAILHWEKTSRYCDNCAGKMERITGEWGKKCTLCGAFHYPRIHPCVIVLVRRGDQLLLVRKPEWPTGRYGLVAGFVEFGENLEQTVVRELMEETGIEVTNICYQGSQSWPFPSQIMAGFTADYHAGEIQLQADELSEGGWFTIDNLPQLPPSRSIARWLIDKTINDSQIDPLRQKG